MGIKGKMWRIVKNLYKKTEAKVRVAGGESDTFETQCGVKQGSVLSPILFSVYVNGLVEEIRKRKGGIMVGKKK